MVVSVIRSGAHCACIIMADFVAAMGVAIVFVGLIASWLVPVVSFE